MSFAAQRQPLRQRQAAADIFSFWLTVARRRQRLRQGLLALDMRQRVADGRNIAVMHEIFPSKCDRVHAQPPRHQIHLRFVGEKALRLARRAHMAAGDFIGVNDFLVDMDVGDLVRPGRFFGSD